jgi:hypothetical protein
MADEQFMRHHYGPTGYVPPKQIGPTGEPPQAPLRPGDQGGLNASLTVDRAGGRLILDFGKSVSWLGMTRQEALRFASLLVTKAKELPPD